MNQYLCCIHDKKSDTYNGFMLFPNMATALRSFEQACDQQDTFKKWPEDFQFVLVCKIGYETGEVNEKGEVLKEAKLLETKDYHQVIAEAKDYVALLNAKNIKEN